MILVDSSVWIDYFNGNQSNAVDRLDRYIDEEQICVGDLILTEVLQGFRSDKDFYLAKEYLSEFETISLVGKKQAVFSASLYRQLRRRGNTPRKTIDVLIAAFCIAWDARLLHSDRDFDVFQSLGLKIA